MLCVGCLLRVATACLLAAQKPKHLDTWLPIAACEPLVETNTLVAHIFENPYSVHAEQLAK